MSAPLLKTVFLRDPTRPLEEVQKVNATAEAERDVEEFHETESARRVLERLSVCVERHPNLDPRFIYLHATFGSGKTHLLKLIGFATGQAGVSATIANQLSNRFGGFLQLRHAFEAAHADAFFPVFLNLLNRDASKEPPLPLLVFKAIGDRLGYPTEPRWLIEFLLQRERAWPEDDFWERLQAHTVQGETLEEKCESDRGRIRLWLYEAVPEVAQAAGVTWTRDDVQSWIAEAEADVEVSAFGAKALCDRVEAVQALLTERNGARTELLLGLDEIALFIGDDRTRYDELREMMQELFEGPNPVVIGTGQWGLREVHRDFVGAPEDDAWYSQEVKLEGADTEVIVRKRWLQKRSSGRSQVEALLDPMPDAPEAIAGEHQAQDAIDAYPLRAGDLRRMRRAMQALLTKGRPTSREHIQGRALLVLVRALFARHGWAERPLGALVPWAELFDLLLEETTLIPTWVEDLIASLEEKPIGQEGRVVDVAKTIYLVNRMEAVPATEEVVVHLLLDRVEADIEALRRGVREALEALTEKKYAFAEPTDGAVTYRLLTEEEVTLAEKIEARAGEVALPRLRSTITEWLKEYSSLLRTEDLRQEVDIGNERDVPLTVHYSVLHSIPEPKKHADAVGMRVLVTGDEAAEVASRWVEYNRRADHLEDLLVAVTLPPNFENELRRYIATADVLRNETRRFPEIQSDQLTKEQELRDNLRAALRAAPVFVPSTEQHLGSFAEVVEAVIVEQVLPQKFPDRRTLERPLRHMDDARALAAFFRDGKEWPLAPADADTLGVDQSKHALRDGSDTWPHELGKAVARLGGGGLVKGEDLIAMIEAEHGAFRGTPVEGLAAVLLVLATARQIQLKQDGVLIREPEAMGRALRNKTAIQRLTVRFEPPPKQVVVEHLRDVHRALIKSGTTPDDAVDLAREIGAWAREHTEEIQQVRGFVARTFDRVQVEALAEVLTSAASNPGGADPEVLTDPDVHRQAKAYDRARQLVRGDAQELWSPFEETRRTMREEDAMARITAELEAVTQQPHVPTPQTLGDLLERVKKYRQQKSSRARKGEPEESYEGGDPEPPDDFESFFEQFDMTEDDDTKEHLETLIRRLNEEASGRIVRIDAD